MSAPHVSSVLRRIGYLVLILGIVITLVALIWWHTVYSSEIQRKQREWGSNYRITLTITDFIPCLYSENARGCPSRHINRPPILLFWLGMIATIGGGIIALAAQPVRTSNHPE